MTSRSSSQRQAIVVAVVLLLLAAPGGVLAQSSMSSGCKACVVPRVSVPVPSVDVLRQAAAREGALLAVALSTTSLKHPPQQRRRWIERHPALTGALLGAPAGFAFGAVKLGGEPFIGTDPISHFGGGLVMLPIGVAFGVMVAGAVVLVTK